MRLTVLSLALAPSLLVACSVSESVENLRAQLVAVPEGRKSVEIFVPEEVTLGGNATRQDIAVVMLVDTMLKRGYLPGKSEKRSGGILLRFQSNG